MPASWQRPFRLNTLYDDWDNAPAYSGVYIIKEDRGIRRIAGTDKAGILYIGKSALLRNRLWGFWTA
jgi:excinuclease UvrABC nuclease subunit